LAHAHLVVGDPRGDAMEFAVKAGQLVLCGGAEPPCGRCASCGLVAERKSPDIMWLEPERKSRIISVETVRGTVIPWAERTSFLGGWKVMVVAFADRFQPAAANAFLKTLEEPPQRTLFLLLTDSPEAMLTTVISRCHRIDLGTGRRPPAEPWRSRIGEALARHRQGSELEIFATASRIETIFDDMKKQAEKEIKAESRESSEEEDAETLNARVEARLRELRMAALVAIQDWYRDMLVLAGGAAEQALFFEEHRAELERRAAQVPVRRALDSLNLVDEMAEQINVHNIQPHLTLSY
jgi:DNA polymerase-3 subunit delta'